MKDSEMFRQLESDAQLLEKIGKQYPPASPENEALHRAALSLAYVVMNERAAFRTFVEEMESDLTDEQRTELRERYGIDE